MKRLVLALCLAASTAWAVPANGIGYEKVKQAFEAVRADPGAKESNQEGWVIVWVAKGTNRGLWAFAPKDHPSYPSAVRRTPVERNGRICLELRTLCGGEKPACEQLFEDYSKLDEKLLKDLEKSR